MDARSPCSHNSSDSRKRQHCPLECPQSNPSLLLHKLNNRLISLPTLEFWDQLSVIHLTKLALVELDRRNDQAAQRLYLPGPSSSHSIAQDGRVKREESCLPFSPAEEYVRHCGAARYKDIKQTSKHGGPDLRDLAGFPEATHPNASFMAPPAPNSADATATPSKKTTLSCINLNFEQALLQNDIFPPDVKHADGRKPEKPTNWANLMQRLSQPRQELTESTFSEDDYEIFRDMQAGAHKDNKILHSLIDMIEGNVGDVRCRGAGIPFSNLASLIGTSYAPANPDIFYGARAEQVDGRIQHQLSKQIVVSSPPLSVRPLAPNFFIIIPKHIGSDIGGVRHVTYAGALGARSMESLKSYGLEAPVFDKKAYVIALTYANGFLEMFTSHQIPPAEPGKSPGYYTHRIRSCTLLDTAAGFRDAVTHVRNAREWAKEQRDELIRQANSRANDVAAGRLIPSLPVPPHPRVEDLDGPFNESG